MKKFSFLCAVVINLSVILGGCNPVHTPTSSTVATSTHINDNIQSTIEVETNFSETDESVSEVVMNTTFDIPYVDSQGNTYNDCEEYNTLYKTIIDNNLYEDYLLTRCDNRVVSYLDTDSSKTYDYMGNQLCLSDIFCDYDGFSEYVESQFSDWYNYQLNDYDRECGTQLVFFQAFRNTDIWYMDANSIVFILKIECHHQTTNELFYANYYLRFTYSECGEYMCSQYLPSDGTFLGIYTYGDLQTQEGLVTTFNNRYDNNYCNNGIYVNYNNQFLITGIDDANDGLDGFSLIGQSLYFVRNVDNEEVLYQLLVTEDERPESHCGIVVYSLEGGTLTIQSIDYDTDKISETIGLI